MPAKWLVCLVNFGVGAWAVTNRVPWASVFVTAQMIVMIRWTGLAQNVRCRALTHLVRVWCRPGTNLVRIWCGYLSRDEEDAVGVDVEANVDLRHPSRRRWQRPWGREGIRLRVDGQGVYRAICPRFF